MKTTAATLFGVLWMAVLTSLIAGTPVQAEQNLSLRAECEKPVLPAGIRQETQIRITIHAPELTQHRRHRTSVNLAVVLDHSGSMGSANKLIKAKEAAITALRMLGPNDLFSLVIYDDHVQTVVPPTFVHRNLAAIEEKIRYIRPGGSTALFAGVALGANEVRKNLSDRVGNDYNEDLMTALSQNSDGNFYFVENSNDLPMIFSKELGSALRVFAKSINIHIECPAGIQPRGFMGHDSRINGNDVDLYLNQVYGGHEKSLILQVDVPPGRPREKLKLADIRLSYNDLNGKKQSLKSQVKATFSNNQREVKANFNKEVMGSVALRKNAILKQQAIQAADQGNLKQASEIMNQAAQQLEEIADVVDNEEVEKELERSKDHAEKLKTQSKSGIFSRDSRKKMRGESYQMLNDQHYKQ